MQAWIVATALLLCLPTLAGCAEEPAPKPDVAETTSFDDLDVEATDTTGVIRGVVVDERISPIESALLSLTGAAEPLQATSDAQGRFAFEGLDPGVYFISAKHLLHLDVQTTADVVAGDSDPPVTKILMIRRFSQEAFHEQFSHDAFIQCNQAGVYYASAPCVTDFTGIPMGLWPSAAGSRPCPPNRPCCTAAGCATELRRIQSESRGFHVALGPGWQTLIYEMTWKETSDTFSQLGLTVSYNETERCACHNFASTGSVAPYRLQLNLSEDHAPNNNNEPQMVPAEGMPAMYYFIGARASPALVINQKVQLFSTFFHYGVPPEGWSFIAGDPFPF